MASIVNKSNLPFGIKIISALIGINAIVALGAVTIRFLRPATYDAKELSIRLMMMGVGALFFLLSLNLWKRKNWARLVVMGLSALIFLMMLYSLIQTRTFPDPIHWWHFYIYPILIVYLALPKTNDVFKGKIRC